jgi:DNA-binding CsgD family transcriptional regulator
MLVRDGHRPRRIAEELGILDCTVRSHLRSIYAKADVDSHVTLLHRLMRPEMPDRLDRVG